MQQPSQEFYVYIHKTKDCGRVFYVGKGKGQRAFECHKRNPHWNGVANKHGVVIEIAFSELTEHQSFYLEKKLIQKIGVENLCNLTPGGEGVSMPWPIETYGKRVEAIRKATKKKEWIEKNHRWTKSEEYKLFASRRSKRFFFNEENRKEHARKAKERASSEENKERVSKQWSGVKRSEETKKKMSESLKFRSRSEKEKKRLAELGKSLAKEVLCIETGCKFHSVFRAEDWLKEKGYAQKCISQQIRHVCKGRAQTACGYSWIYTEDMQWPT